MAQLLTDTQSLIKQINTNIDGVLSSITTFKNIYNTDYILSEVKDADYLKSLMKEKIELGIRDYDNQ